MTDLLPLDADQLLSTTRAVRKRLDLTKPVPRELIMECVDLAIQAPTGSNTQGWRWIFVDDPTKKQALADLYGKTFDPYRAMMTGGPSPYAADDTRALRSMAVTESATYLRDHFHEVPVMMIPLMAGRPDSSGTGAFQAGAWGSIIPAVWSFCLAARARGLGTAWTTLHLFAEEEAAKIIGIDHTKWTQVGLFPVAYTLGTDFKPAPRLDAAGLVQWNDGGDLGDAES